MKVWRVVRNMVPIWVPKNESPHYSGDPEIDHIFDNLPRRVYGMPVDLSCIWRRSFGWIMWGFPKIRGIFSARSLIRVRICGSISYPSWRPFSTQKPRLGIVDVTWISHRRKKTKPAGKAKMQTGAWTSRCNLDFNLLHTCL